MDLMVCSDLNLEILAADIIAVKECMAFASLSSGVGVDGWALCIPFLRS